jgi:S-adenosylmethionine-diacylglycerol 3-amino-3-carboxypropyl transferase
MAARDSFVASARHPKAMRSEAAARADFGAIRYAQVWEDADVLLAALEVQPGDVCLSIASAGDNAVALLTKDPARVIALDLSPAQLACLELRVAAYKTLRHGELLELIGSRPSNRRTELFDRCQPVLGQAAREFWHSRRPDIERGIGSLGKFERYFELFRTRVLPLVHSRPTVLQLLERKPLEDRRRFYQDRWDNWRWRLMFRVFFSRPVMGRLGRDPEFFRYVDADVAGSILQRTRHALTELDPSDNPYVHWILTGTHGTALPCALRPEHFETIRSRIERLEWCGQSLEEFLASCPDAALDRLNLSDVFEYVSLDHYHRTLELIVRRSRRGARLAYWNMLAPRRRPDSLGDRLRPLEELAGRLHLEDKAFFYSALRVEEVR